MSPEKQLERLRNLAGNDVQLNEIGLKEELGAIEANRSSIAIKILTIVGGFLAAQAFMGFLIISGLYENELAMILTGILLIVGSLAAPRYFQLLIADTLGICAFLIGCGALAIGLGLKMFEVEEVALVLAGIGVIALRVNSNYVLAFVSVLLVTGSIQFAIFDFGGIFGDYLLFTSVATMMTFFVMKEASILPRRNNISKSFDAIRAGLIVAFVFQLYMTRFSLDLGRTESFVWIPSLVNMALLLFVIHQILNERQIIHQKAAILIGSVILLAPTIFAPAISGSLLILILCFHKVYKTGMAIGVVCLILAITRYYYELSLTLLEKSILMMASGILFLLMLHLIKKVDVHEN